MPPNVSANADHSHTCRGWYISFCVQKMSQFQCSWYVSSHIANYIQYSSSWKAIISSDSQEIPRILWKPKVHYRNHKRQQPVPILSNINILHVSQTHFLKIRFNIIPPSTPRSSKWFFSPVFATKLLYVYSNCPAHLIYLDMIIRIIFRKEYRSESSSSCSFLHSPVTSSLLGPNIFPSTLFSNTLSLPSSLNMADQVSHPYKTGKKL